MKTKLLAVSIIIISIGLLGLLFWKDYNKVTIVKVFDKDNLIYPFWVAEDNGYLSESKIKIEKFEANKERANDGDSWNKDNSSYVKWLAENMPDVATVSTDNFLDLENKYPGKYKAFAFLSDTEQNYMSNIVVYKDSSIKNSGDLSGKTVVTGIYDIDQLILSEYLRSNNILDVKTQKVDYTNIDDYLTLGKADALYLQEPKASQLVLLNKDKIIVKNPSSNIDGDLKNAQTRVFVISSDFLAKNKRGAKRLMNAFEKSISVSDDKIRESLKNHLDSSWDKIIEERTFAKIDLYKTVDKSKLEKIVSMLYEGKYIEKKPNLDNLIYAN